ncbi:ABC transporter substrate-binding protein [Streptomyces tardus]|uniref:ABC transporter substrate-binding protein n=1 Tax=Streptomyces tardus TaxID=2780544 RepID=UPI001F3B839B|nr:ABC transporter substrate-binding protein [Streptomyces tardus]
MSPVLATRRAFLTLTGAAAVAVGCGRATGGGSGGSTDTLRYQGWAGQVTPAELAEELGYLEGVKLKWVGNTISGPQDIQSAASGEVDFGGAFNGAVIKLAAAKAPVTAVISYYGSDRDAYHGFTTLDDGSVRTARDLIGKKVGMNTLGAHAEAMLDIYLQREGLSEKEAERVERLVVPPVNIEQTLRKQQIHLGALDGVLREKALERGGVRVLFSDHAILGDSSAGTYVIADRFIDRNPETVRAFVTGVGRAIEWARAAPRAEVVELKKKVIRDRGRNEDTAALAHWRSYGVAGTGGRIAPKELNLWLDWLRKRGDIKAGQVKVSDIYTNEFNDSPKTAEPRNEKRD